MHESIAIAGNVEKGTRWQNKLRENGWARGERVLEITHVDIIDQEVEYLMLTPCRGDPLNYMTIRNLLIRYERASET